jgi:glutamate--cysteine ligase
MRPVAELLNEVHGTEDYTRTCDEQLTKLRDPERTPSARVLALMASQQIPFFRFAMNQSIAQKGYFDEHPLRGRTLKDFDAIARNSLKRQQEIEAADTVGFDEFLEAYLAFK